MIRIQVDWLQRLCKIRTMKATAKKTNTKKIQERVFVPIDEETLMKIDQIVAKNCSTRPRIIAKLLRECLK